MNEDKCFYYNGKYYDVGTKVKMKTKSGEVITTFLGCIRDPVHKCTLYHFDGFPPRPNFTHLIIEIINPIYYQESPVDESKKANIFFRTGSGSAAHDDDIFHGFLLYLVVMIGAVIFNDRWLIWVSATIIYFSWLKRL